MTAQRLWLFVLTAAPFAALAQPGESFTLRGKVVDRITRGPVSGAIVRPWMDGWRPSADPVTTGLDGRFAWHNLAAGQYDLRVVAAGEMFAYHELSDYGPLYVRIGPGKEDIDVLFPIQPHPSISGFVRDEFGDPVDDADVNLDRRDWRDGHVVFTGIRRARTDDQGHYHFIDVRPGAYRIYCSTGVANATVVPQTGGADFRARPETRYYKRAFYPSEPSGTFRLDWTEQRRVDLTLGSASAIPVRGHVSGTTSKSNSYVSLSPDDGTGYASPSCEVAPDGNFECFVLEPGPYRVAAGAYSPTQSFTATRTITVDNAGTKGIELSLQPAGEVEVLMRTPKGSNGGGPDIGLRPTGPGDQEVDWARLSKTAPGPPAVFPNPGTYWLVTRNNGSLCVESARIEGKEVLHGVVNVTPGMSSRLDVTLSDQCAEFDGHVVSRNKPVSFANVAVLQSGSPKTPGDVFVLPASEDGYFSSGPLPAGRYLVWAWNSDDPAYPGPASLADVEALATSVVLAKGRKGHAGTIHVLEEAATK
jgi:hypothetical protein